MKYLSIVAILAISACSGFQDDVSNISVKTASDPSVKESKTYRFGKNYEYPLSNRDDRERRWRIRNDEVFADKE